jgi:hypothetical protein
MFRLLLWLLCIVAPFVGLVAGNKLVPEHRALWQKTFQHRFKLLGYVEEGQTLLMIDYSHTKDGFLVGLESRTGEEKFREPMSESLLGAQAYYHETSRLSRDGKYILMNATRLNDPKRYVLCYDWRAKQVKYCFSLASQTMFEKLQLAGDYLYTFTGRTLVQWNLRTPEKEPCLLPMEEKGPSSELINQISQDGQWCYFGKGLDWVVEELVPPHSQRKIPDTMWKIFDLPHGQQLRRAGNRFGMENPGLVINTYEARNGEFILTSASERYEFTGNIQPQENCLVIRGRRNETPFARMLQNRLGAKWYEYYLKLFPVSSRTTMYILDQKTTRLLGYLPAPNWVDEYFISLQAGLLSYSVNNHIHGWEIAPFARWYPTLGLAIGLMISLTLIVLWFRGKKRTVQQPTPNKTAI